MKRKVFCCLMTAAVLLLGYEAGVAQKAARMRRIDSLALRIDNGKADAATLRRYISILGYANDTVTEHFTDWMSKFPKVYLIPRALGDAYYEAKDKKATQYYMKAWQAGDTSKSMFRRFGIAADEKWALDVPRTANTVDSLKRVIEQHPDSLLPLQQYIFVMDDKDDVVTAQIETWMKRFPKSVAMPFALGEKYYNEEDPRAKPYLLRVVELQPQNDKVYEMLSIDAERWGNNEQAKEYMGKAVAAAPSNAAYAFYYIYFFKESDPARWRQLTWELTKKFPADDRGAQALYWLGEDSKDKNEKIEAWTKMKELYPPDKFGWSESGMNALFDLYLKEGMTDKAVELATSMGKADGFPEKVELAKTLADIRSLAKEKQYAEAQAKLTQIKLPRYSSAVNTVALLKAEIRDAAGSTQLSYDSLVLIQAKTPDEDINRAVMVYGGKLGKDAGQIEKDIRAVREKFSKPAPPFELGLYTSSGKAKLEDYKGKVVLLTFWFPGCGPCRGEMPHFQNVVDKFNKKDLAYLGINVLPEQDPYVLSFMKGTKFSFTPLRGNSKWAEQTYHVRGEPTNFLIDQQGKIMYSDFMINGNNERMLELMINSLLDKKEVASSLGKFSVQGMVGHLNPPAMAYLSYNKDASDLSSPSVTDSVLIKDGRFLFRGEVGAVGWARISIKHQGAGEVLDRRNDDGLFLYLEPAAITVEAVDSVKHGKISGSVVNDENAQLEAMLKPVYEKSDTLRAVYQKKTAEEKKDRAFAKWLTEKEDELDREKMVIYKSFISTHLNSPLALLTFKQQVLGYNIDVNTAEADLAKFSPALLASPLGMSAKERIAKARKTSVGAMAIDFSQPDVDGRMVKLSDFQGKYVLLDFWASWCGPCRMENPNVLAVYNKYKDRNFTILSVSMDYPGKKDKWLAAIKEDKLAWTQVSDLKGWDNPVAQLYDIQGIPTNYLLDPTGKILAVNIMGDELDKKVGEVTAQR